MLQDERVGKLLREYEKEGKMVAAICAGMRLQNYI